MPQPPVNAVDVPEQAHKTIYPAAFAAVVQGRRKRKLGDYFALNNFGVNLIRLQPGAASALQHHHSRQDEFIYILDGTPTLILGEQEFVLTAGQCCGFRAGDGVAHQLVNRSQAPVSYLEIGDRTVGDQVEYPHDDLKAEQLPNGVWLLTHKDGRPYPQD